MQSMETERGKRDMFLVIDAGIDGHAGAVICVGSLNGLWEAVCRELVKACYDDQRGSDPPIVPLAWPWLRKRALGRFLEGEIFIFISTFILS